MNLGQLHLEFSTSICEGIDKNLHHENRKGLFPNLQDLKGNFIKKFPLVLTIFYND